MLTTLCRSQACRDSARREVRQAPRHARRRQLSHGEAQHRRTRIREDGLITTPVSSSLRIDFEQFLDWYESVEIAVLGDLRIDPAGIDECGATALDALCWKPGDFLLHLTFDVGSNLVLALHFDQVDGATHLQKQVDLQTLSGLLPLCDVPI